MLPKDGVGMIYADRGGWRAGAPRPRRARSPRRARTAAPAALNSHTSFIINSFMLKDKVFWSNWHHQQQKFYLKIYSIIKVQYVYDYSFQFHQVIFHSHTCVSSVYLFENNHHYIIIGGFYNLFITTIEDCCCLVSKAKGPWLYFNHKQSSADTKFK